MPLRALIALPVLLLAAAVAGRAAAADANVAALQVALHARGLYAGSIDGVVGPGTRKAVRRFQRRVRLAVDGVAGPRTRRALGRYSKHQLGTRVMRRGQFGWDVAALQFLLARHGFPSGTIDGTFGPRTENALRHFQRWHRLAQDGRAGPATLRLLQGAPPRSPISFARPLPLPVGDVFGARGARFHTGLDFPAPFGTAVVAARAGRVVFAGWHRGGYGYLVTVSHGYGVKTRYAHLASIAVGVGARVTTGMLLGRVGSTGHSTGPHLHFEVRVRGAAVNPVPVLR